MELNLFFLLMAIEFILPVNIFAMACRFRWRIIKALSGSDYVLFFWRAWILSEIIRLHFYVFYYFDESKILSENSEEIPLFDSIREGNSEMKIIHRRWDSKYFITILCFMLVLMINIHLLMNKKGALADYLFDAQPVSSRTDC